MAVLALFTALFAALVFAPARGADPRPGGGTRAVAAGDLGVRLPVTSHDDVGALVESFNDMTARLAAAGEEGRRNAAAIERSA